MIEDKKSAKMSLEIYQAHPLDLSCKVKVEHSETQRYSAETRTPDDRRLSNSSDYTDRSPSRSPDSLEGGPRKRFLSKFFQPQIKGKARVFLELSIFFLVWWISAMSWHQVGVGSKRISHFLAFFFDFNLTFFD